MILNFSVDRLFFRVKFLMFNFGLSKFQFVGVLEFIVSGNSRSLKLVYKIFFKILEQFVINKYRLSIFNLEI